MKSNERIRAAILEVVDNQLNANEPPETKQTFDRLLSEGNTKEEAKRLIGAIVSSEIFDVMKSKETFNLKRFINRLEALPKMPWD